jgi:uncharacterized phage protein gp47/JayE
MAEIPVPRSYPDILGEQVDAFLARLGIPAPRAGDPSLSILEAASQSDARNSQDLFQFLNSLSLDRATGLALDRIGAGEDTPRRGETASTGSITVTDSSFAKKQSRVYQGASAPIVGSLVVRVEDASGFPGSGSLYLGRGTTNYEGPLVYVTNVTEGNHYLITLSGSNPTQKYHNLGESVILAQGGNRSVPVGSTVQTPKGNVGSTVQFSTSFGAAIPDGETEVLNVPVTCTQPGLDGNVSANNISTFTSPPFTGAVASNPTAFTNGRATEMDDEYRERIRAARNTRSRGTSLAITSGVTGITAIDENRQVISTSLVVRQNYPVTLYIDDGTGYEERSEGIPFEVLSNSASGGDIYFALTNGRPVTKAYRATSLTAPFDLTAGSRLSVLVGGILSEHDFLSSEFRSIDNASAYEVTASINAKPLLTFSARTMDSGSRVALFAKSDTNEDIEVISPSDVYVDANLGLGFPAGKAYSLSLYKNDRLLNKDGTLATLTSKAQSLWSSISSGAILNIEVDGIALPTSLTTFDDIDFVNAGTAYNTVSEINSLDSWASVFNYKIPGITAVVSAGYLVLTSNCGRASRAKVVITGGTLGVAMFEAASSQGSSRDYTLDRNMGNVTLETALSAGDRLTAGSFSTRGFLESAPITALTIAADVTNDPGDPTAGAELWVVVDGNAQLQATGISAGTTIAISSSQTGNTQSWGRRVRITHASQGIWNKAQIGDWVIIQDPAFSVNNRGAFRVAEVHSAATKLWIEIERPVGGFTTETVALTRGHVRLVRTNSAEPQRVLIPAGPSLTPLTLSDAFNAQLQGAEAQTYRTTKFRLRTDTFGLGGDIALVSSNAQGLLLGLPVSSAVTNLTPHLASIPAGHPQDGTPGFDVSSISSVASKTAFDIGTLGEFDSGSIAVGLRAVPDSSTLNRYSNKNHTSSLEVIASTTLNVRHGALQHWLPEDRLYSASPYGITARDRLGFVIDGDEVTKRYVLNTYRKVTPGSATYGASNDFKDADNLGLSLARTFGLDFDWLDFAVHMQARTKSHSSPDTTKTGLWRFKRHGPEGNTARVQYQYPIAASAPVAVENDALSSAFTDVKIRLPAGAARSGMSVRNTSYFGMAVTAGPTAGPTGGLYDYLYVLNLPVVSATRVVIINYASRNATVFAGTITGGTSTATATVVADSNPGAGVQASGYLIIVPVTGSFVSGETITTGGGASATTSGIAYGLSTLTLTLPAPITDHGLLVGSAIYLQSTDINFSSGIKLIGVATATTIAYIDTPVPAGPVASIGSVSRDVVGECTLSGSTVVNGDIFNVGSGTSFGSPFVRTVKLQTLDGAGRNFTAQSDVAGTPVTTLTWSALNTGSNVGWYPIGGSNTIANIVAAVNAISTSSIKGVAVGTGGVSTGTISNASYEASELGGNDPWYYLSDGINWVRSQVNPGSLPVDFNMTFKDAVTANLASNSDWDNEDVRLVPVTALNVANYLNSPGVSGLFGATEVVTSIKGGRPQVTSTTPGGEASVRSDGGTANQLVSSIIGPAIQVGVTNTAVATVSDGDSQGLGGRLWVSLNNASPAPKATIDASTALTSIAGNGTVTLNSGGTKAWDWANAGGGAIDNRAWQIEKHGDFVAFTWVDGSAPTISGIEEGDWVIIEAATTPPGGTSEVNVLNRGQFRVVRVKSGEYTFWIENSSAVEEIGACKLRFLTYDSVMPGDKLIINTSLWGSDNLGSWVVSGIDATDRWVFTLSITDRAPVPQGAVAALGGSSGLVKVYEGQPTRLIKRISAISPNAIAGLTDLKFDTDASYKTIGSSYGTVLRALDKLSFGIDTLTGVEKTLATGSDGYRHSTGLIAEANAVVYGDETSRSSYPGIAAAGAHINIVGPLVKRIRLSFAIRTQTGVAIQDVKNEVKSSVAAIINDTPVGVKIAIGTLIAAAQSVNGVVAVTLLSPSYGPGEDLIPVQPFEKPLVLNIDDDILVSQVGE